MVGVGWGACKAAVETPAFPRQHHFVPIVKIHFIPCFCRVGVKFVLDHRAHGWLQDQVGALVKAGQDFALRQGDKSSLVVYLDGHEDLREPKVFGPVMDKRAGEMEMRIIVPQSQPRVDSPEEVCGIVRTILNTLVDKLPEHCVDITELARAVDSITERFRSREWDPEAAGLQE
jgi:hypothetical protein